MNLFIILYSGLSILTPTLYHNLLNFRLIDKEINETCNDFKGHGEECHAFCERRFEGRVKVPITRVLGGDRFDVVFEACVGN